MCIWNAKSKIKKVRNLIAKNNIESAFSDLEELTTCLDNKGFHKSWIFQKRRWVDNKLKEDGEAKDITNNQIIAALLNLCKDVEAEAIHVKKAFKKKIIGLFGVLLVLLIILLTVRLLSAPKYLYKGAVMNENEISIGFVPVRVYKGVRKEFVDSFSTDNKGVFEYYSNMKPGELYFDIEKEGYQLFSSSLPPTTPENKPSPIILTNEK